MLLELVLKETKNPKREGVRRQGISDTGNCEECPEIRIVLVPYMRISKKAGLTEL